MLSLEYVAGFFDGEGSIGLYANGRGDGHTLRVQVTQNISPESTALLTEMQVRWGGSLCAMNPSRKREAWNWQASSGKGYRFLLDVRPHLLFKAAQADVATAWWETRPPRLRASTGRLLPFASEVHELARSVGIQLKSMKREA